jgi:exosome complex component RRP4
MDYFKNYDVVTPGDLLSDEKHGGEGTYTEDKKIFSKYFGMLHVGDREMMVSPLTSVYEPHEGDDIVGQVIEVSSKYWVVDINAPYYTRLDARDLNFRAEINELDRYIQRGDYIYARVFRVYTGNHAADISMRGTRYAKLPSNLIVRINPMKIPRLIGKEGAMINAIKTGSGCDVIIGQNGIVWIDGDEDKKPLAIEAVELVQREYYNPNLAEKVRELFEHVQ